MTNKSFNLICYIVLAIVLFFVYKACFTYSVKGYGYPGYRGYHHHHSSFWYIRHYDHSYSSSVRENSAYGSKYSRKGISGGK